jgi:hypothetical protein
MSWYGNTFLPVVSEVVTTRGRVKWPPSAVVLAARLECAGYAEEAEFARGLDDDAMKATHEFVEDMAGTPHWLKDARRAS